MKVLLLFDLAMAPSPEQDYSEDLRAPVAAEWESEAAVAQALSRLGHTVRLFGICDDIQILIDRIRNDKPDLVFNLTEAFAGDRAREPHVVALLELLQQRYTGARPIALQLCKDKQLAQRLVSDLKIVGFRTPRSILVKRGDSLSSLGQAWAPGPWPLFVKPAGLESSSGIARGSLVTSAKQCEARINFVHDRLEQDALIEEYIDGRELYVGVLGDGKGGIEVLPPRELFFGGSRAPRFATQAVKWDDAYRMRWGIRNGPAHPLSPALKQRIEKACLGISAALRLESYARIDLRFTDDGEIVFLEANPNPSIAEGDDFALSAKAFGLTYQALIGRIIKLSAAEKPARRRSGLSRRCAEAF